MERCPLCTSSSLNKLFDEREESYYHCLFCDLIALSPSSYLSKEEERERYLLHNNTPENEGYVKMFRHFLDETILPFVEERGLSLDYGCGPGPVLKMLLEEEGFSVDIYDPFFYPTIHRERSYLLLTSTEVLEHIGEVRSVWLDFEHLVRPHGYLALMTHFHPGPERFHNWWYKRDPTHVVFYSQKTFSHIESAYPWEILYQDGEKKLLLRKSSSSL